VQLNGSPYDKGISQFLFFLSFKKSWAMIKLILDHNKLSQIELKNRLEYIFKKMNGNAAYTMFQALLAILGVLYTDYDKALFEEDGSQEKRDTKNKLKAEALIFLSKFARKIEVVANDLPTKEEALAFAKGTGFTVQETTTRKSVDFLAVPEDFELENDKLRKGGYYSGWKRTKGAISYTLEELDDKGVILNAIHTTSNKLVLSCEPSVLKNYRLRANGTDTLVSDYTETLTVFVR
jgi:hypothetical protein